MNAHYDDLEDGVRVDITVNFRSRRVIETPNGQVHNLTVTDDDGREFTILATPAADPLPDAASGSRYVLSNLVGSAPLTQHEEITEACPDCTEALRHGRAVDAIDGPVAEAAAQLGVGEPFGVLDAEASARRLNDDTGTIDDWQQMQSSGPSNVGVPRFVCDACGWHGNRARAGEAGPVELLDNQQMVGSASVNESPPTASATAAEETVGLAAGGAKDVENFRENIAEGYTPQPEAISDEGLFYDYYFETGEPRDTDALFAPRYAAAAADHPLTGDTEQYLSVGLDSTLSMAEFDRPRLELVAVLDVSGSMDSPFDTYYYDEHGRRREGGDNAAETKLEAATRSLCVLTEQLRDDDRLGVVLYNNRAHVAKPLRDVGTTDMPAIRRHIREVSAGGGTNLADGFEAAMDMLVDTAAEPGVERRVVFMTDMMPNMGTTRGDALTTLFADAAEEGVHSTFIGMGLDANAELAETLSGIRGANHYFIHSAAEFEQRLSEEFDYMVTPLVYDLTLELDADGYTIETVHGSPTADADGGQLMHVGTLFPSAKEDGEARGGVVLVRVSQHRADASLSLTASWRERDGSTHSEEISVEMPVKTNSFDHHGIRKAIALTRYAAELRSWAQEVHQRDDAATGVDDWLIENERGEHELESVSLAVPSEYAHHFDQLHRYLSDEMNAVADESIEQELELLETLYDAAPSSATEGVREP